ncbi:MAG: hypothetical protein ACOH2F_06165 [Cellulomonas sp.]
MAAILAGLVAAGSAGIRPIKINAVLMRGVNDRAALPLLGGAVERGDVGLANVWRRAT